MTNSIVLPYALDFEEESHRYLLNGNQVPSVTQVIKSAGLSEVEQFYTPEAAQRGTAVHAACQYDDEETLGDCTENLLGYLNGWRKFRAESGFVPTHIEIRLASERYQFAGALDRIGALNGKPSLLDIKSGAFCRWHAIQLAAYWILISETHAVPSLPRIETFLVVCVAEDGTYKTHSISATEIITSREIFLYALSIHRWKDSHK